MCCRNSHVCCIMASYLHYLHRYCFGMAVKPGPVTMPLEQLKRLTSQLLSLLIYQCLIQSILGGTTVMSHGQITLTLSYQVASKRLCHFACMSCFDMLGCSVNKYSPSCYRLQRLHQATSVLITTTPLHSILTGICKTETLQQPVPRKPQTVRDLPVSNPVADNAVLR